MSSPVLVHEFARSLISAPVSIAGSDIDALEARHTAEKPVLVHSLKHDRSILSIAVSASTVYAGTEEGEILVRPLTQFLCKRVSDMTHLGFLLGYLSKT